MDEQGALRLLASAVHERDETSAIAEQARRQLYGIIRRVAPTLKQVDIVRATGWTREHIRNIVENKNDRYSDHPASPAADEVRPQTSPTPS